MDGGVPGAGRGSGGGGCRRGAEVTVRGSLRGLLMAGDFPRRPFEDPFNPLTDSVLAVAFSGLLRGRSSKNRKPYYYRLNFFPPTEFSESKKRKAECVLKCSGSRDVLRGEE